MQPCSTVSNQQNKASYVRVRIGDANSDNKPDSGILYHYYSAPGGASYYVTMGATLYRGNADSLSILQNRHVYPEQITGLAQTSQCYEDYSRGYQASCVVPGSYTQVVSATDQYVGAATEQDFRFTTPANKYNAPSLAENLGSLVDTLLLRNRSQTISQDDNFTCTDNPLTIAGHLPCAYAGSSQFTKFIYREFYLSRPAYVNISASGNRIYHPNRYRRGFTMSLFAGRASAGVGGLSVVSSNYLCTNYLYTPNCMPLQPGWYTVVTYGKGPNVRPATSR